MKRDSPRRSIPMLALALCAAIVIAWACTARGEGGEPRYFAMKNARIVTVSGRGDRERHGGHRQRIDSGGRNECDDSARGLGD